MKVKVTNGTVVLHTAYNECSNQYVVTMKMKVIAMATSLALILTLGVLATLHTQFAFAAPMISPLTPDLFNIQSGNSDSGNSSGYIVCNPNCHVSSNSGSSDSGSGNSGVEAAYRLTVNVPSHPFGTSTVGISITTANGYTDQANVLTAGGSSYTFNIPKNEGNSVQVCVNSGTLSQDNCHTYETTGTDMSVSLSAVSTTGSGTNDHHTGTGSSNPSHNISTGHHVGYYHGGDGGYYHGGDGGYFPGYNGFYGHPY
ncbi:MAG: hypothetical protein WAM14_02920 [Candidatus Nitrosopolaris sp.]